MTLLKKNVKLILGVSKSFTSHKNLINFKYSSMESLKIFITRSDVPQAALDLLKNFDVEIWKEQGTVPRDVLLKKVAEKNALFIHSGDQIDKQVLSAATNVKVIGTMSAGVDHIDVTEAKAKGIKIGTASGVLEAAVAELAIGLLISGIRKFYEGYNLIVGGNWPERPPWDWMNGGLIKGSVVSLLGCGSIGLEILQRITAFKPAKVYYFARKPKKEADKLGAVFNKLNAICAESDIIIVALSLNNETRGILNEEKFNMMKSNAFIVNISRGDVIDQPALVKAVRDKKIGGAALDVMSPEPLPPKHELLSLKNITLTPHIGSAETSTRIKMAKVTAENIIAGLTNKKLISEV